MTTVSNTANTPATTPPSATAAAQASDTEFLSMLTTELTNQDPTNPTDTATFTSQLVSMSGLEQQITTNSKLDGMTAILAQLAASQTSPAASGAAASGS